MRIRQSSSRPRRPAGLRCSPLLFGLLTLALAGCGSSASGGSKQGSKQGSSSASKANSSSASVTTTKVPGYGTVLASAHGAPLYLLTADHSGTSSCSASCAKQWPPLTVKGTPSAGSGVSGALLSSFTRSDGRVQVQYAGHALYTHPGTSASAVAGTASDGGIWYLVSPSGKPVKSTNGSGY